MSKKNKEQKKNGKNGKNGKNDKQKESLLSNWTKRWIKAISGAES